MPSSIPVKAFDKDPSEQLDYVLNWAKTLNGDTISTSDWAVPAGITSVGKTLSQTTTAIWLNSGTAGTSYSVTNTIVTVGGRTFTRTIQINVVLR